MKKFLLFILLGYIFFIVFPQTTSVQAINANFKNVGFFGVDCEPSFNHLQEVGQLDVSNVAHINVLPVPEAKAHACLEKARQYNIKLIIGVQWQFFLDQGTLRSDWQFQWDYLKSLIAGYEDTIWGFYFDEPQHDGGHPSFQESAFRTATQKIRTDFPTKRLLVVEAYTRLSPQKKSYYEFATDLGFDWYSAIDYTFPDWSIGGYTNYYNQFKQNLVTNQNIWIIPQTFMQADPFPSESRMLDIFNNYIAFAEQRSEIVGVLYFLYSPIPGNIYAARSIVQPSGAHYLPTYTQRLMSVSRDIRSRATSPTPTAPPQPTNFTATCGTNGIVNLSWSAVSGITTYALRVDNLGNAWTGVCPATNTGDICLNVTTTSYSYTAVPGQNYSGWVHALNSLGDFSARKEVTFSCPVQPTTTPTRTPTQPPVISLTPTPSTVVSPTNANPQPTTTPTPTSVIPNAPAWFFQVTNNLRNFLEQLYLTVYYFHLPSNLDYLLEGLVQQ